MKTICFDIRALQIGHEKRGIGMYIKSVLESLPSDENKYLLYAFDKNNPIKDLGINLNINYELIQTKTIKTKIETPRDLLDAYKLARHSFHPIKKYRPDVFIQFDFNLGIPKWKSIKTIVIGYDLIPLVLKRKYLPDAKNVWQNTAGIGPKLKGTLRSIYYKTKSKINYRVYKKCDKIISISDSTTKSFIKLLRVNQEKITTIHLAPVLSNDKPDYSILNDIKKAYIFYVGGTDIRKKVNHIVNAFNITRGRGMDLELVLAGSEFTNAKTIPDVEARNAVIKSAYTADIRLIGFVNDAQKKALYERAHAFIFTSIYEGFGLPLLEAMASSCPAISYNNSSIPEAAGEAALLVKTGDYIDISNKIIELEDKKLRKEIIEKGLSQVSNFSWDKYAKQFIEIIKQGI